MKKPAMVVGSGTSKSEAIDRRELCIVGNAVSWSKTTITCMYIIIFSRAGIFLSYNFVEIG